MKCGIKFCGGCNPRYERGAASRQIQEELNNIEFEYAEEGVDYDHLLVIGGCTACCASYQQYRVNGEVIKMYDAEMKESVVNKLEELAGL